MPTYRRETRVPAPLADVWEFHSHPEGLERLTPDWMHLRVEAVRGPDGERDPEVLEAGSQIRLSVQPFGVGPRQTWVSLITEREETAGSAYFVDEMRDGPFAEWHHTHAFFADGEETVLVDTVRYALPFGVVGDAVGPVAKVGFAGMFRQRHARTREMFASE